MLKRANEHVNTARMTSVVRPHGNPKALTVLAVRCFIARLTAMGAVPGVSVALVVCTMACTLVSAVHSVVAVSTVCTRWVRLCAVQSGICGCSHSEEIAFLSYRQVIVDYLCVKGGGAILYVNGLFLPTCVLCTQGTRFWDWLWPMLLHLMGEWYVDLFSLHFSVLYAGRDYCCSLDGLEVIYKAMINAPYND